MHRGVVANGSRSIGTILQTFSYLWNQRQTIYGTSLCETEAEAIPFAAKLVT